MIFLIAFLILIIIFIIFIFKLYFIKVDTILGFTGGLGTGKTLLAVK